MAKRINVILSQNSAVLVAFFYALVLVATFRPALQSGRIMYPVDILYQWSPWSSDAPRDWQGCANCLLSDEVQQYYPYASYREERLRSGQLPLWDPYALSGTPFVAGPQSAVFYPINLLTLILPLDQSFAVSDFLRLFICGTLTFLFARQVGTTVAAAALSGLAFMLCAYNIMWLGYPHINAIAFLPGVLLFLARLTFRPSITSFVGLSVSIACMILGGHPEECLHAVVLIVPITAVLVQRASPIRANLGGAIVRVAGVVSGAAIGVGIAGVQSLPFADYLQSGSAMDLRSFAGRSPMRIDWWTSATFFDPTFFGSPAAHLSWARPNLNEICGYVGLPTICLTICALLYIRQDWRVGLFAGIGSFALAIAYGMWPLFDWFTMLPGFHQAANHRLLYVAQFCAALLAGVGIDCITSQVVQNKFRAATYVVVGLSMVILLSAFLFWKAGQEMLPDLTSALQRLPRVAVSSINPESAGLMHFGITLALTCVILTLLVTFPKRSRLVWALNALLAADLCLTWTGYNPAVGASLGFATTPEVVQYLQSQPRPFRMVGIGFPTLAPDTPTVYSLEDVRGYDIPSSRRYTQFFRSVVGHSDGIAFNVDHVTDTSLKFLRMLGVRYYVSPDPLSIAPLQNVLDAPGSHLYADSSAAPRVFLMNQVTLLSYDDALKRLRDPSFDPLSEGFVDAGAPRTVVERLARVLPPAATSLSALLLVDRPTAAPLGATSVVASSKLGSVSFRSIEPEYVTLDVNATSPMFVVLADSYDSGWHASVNGVATPVLPYDVALQAVRVPAGHSSIDIWYLPGSFVLGVFASILSALLLVCLAGLAAVRDRRRIPA